MSNKKTFFGKLFNKNKGTVTLQVDILEYNEDEIHYIYCPALDLVGYGATPDEARQSWNVVLEEYINYTVNKNTLAQDLKKHGWVVKLNSEKTKEFTPPPFTWIVQNNPQAKEVYNLREFSKRITSVHVPCFA